MSVVKTLLKHPHLMTVLSWLLACYIRLVYITSRKIRRIDTGAIPYMNGEKNGIFAFWHGRMAMLPAFNPPRKMHVLISIHRDGKLISDVIRHFNQSTISGSSSNRGKEAVSEILQALESGDNISITPDGPRGPAFVCSRGIASLARWSQKPVVPVTFSSSRAVHFNSWDKFMLPLPFGRLQFCVGAPIFISDEEEELSCKRIEQAMNALVIMADEAAHV